MVQLIGFRLSVTSNPESFSHSPFPFLVPRTNTFLPLFRGFALPPPPSTFGRTVFRSFLSCCVPGAGPRVPSSVRASDFCGPSHLVFPFRADGSDRAAASSNRAVRGLIL